jgi:hypothetical protein
MSPRPAGDLRLQPADQGRDRRSSRRDVWLIALIPIPSATMSALPYDVSGRVATIGSCGHPAQPGPSAGDARRDRPGRQHETPRRHRRCGRSARPPAGETRHRSARCRSGGRGAGRSRPPRAPEESDGRDRAGHAPGAAASSGSPRRPTAGSTAPRPGRPAPARPHTNSAPRSRFGGTVDRPARAPAQRTSSSRSSTSYGGE